MDLDAGDSPWGDVPSQSDSRPAAASKSTEEAGEGSNDNDDPTATSTGQNQQSSLNVPRSSTGRGPRTPRKVSAQATRLEAVDGSLDPLGPLGGGGGGGQADFPPVASASEQGPPPPRKEPSTSRNARPTSASASSQALAGSGMMDSVDLEDDTGLTSPKLKAPPPVQPPQQQEEGEGTRRQSQPSMSVEQAAKPKFDITVGDPHKVGDLTSSHIVYQVRTKTTSKAYRESEFTVSRRYRDFLWLYNSLHNNNPGVVVPPPPEKQAVGRFDTNFVESRRAALERMLNKTAAHPTLQHDGDLKIFLESDTFTLDVKNKENREPDLGQSKGMFSSFGLSVGGSSSKFIEHDDWFHDRKIYLDALENQLRSLLKTVDTVVSQRKGLAEAAGDFSASIHALAAVELSSTLSGPLEGLSELQLRIKELYERQAQQDVLTLGITIDEYIRLIGSVKTAFSQRQKSFHSWHAAESELQKRKNSQEKLLRQGSSQKDKLNQVNADVADAERKVHQARLLFEDMGRVMRNELEKFEKEKVEDFKSGVETFLESAVEAQKELIELWETFLMQLDSDEDTTPYYKPPVPVSEEPSHEPQQAPSGENRSSAEAAAEAAAAAVAEEHARENPY